MVRRSLAGAAGLIVLLALVFGIKACSDARGKQAIRNYTRDVGALVQESDQQGKALFKLLSNSDNAGAVDIENALNTSRSEAGQLVDRVRGLNVPGDMQGAQRYLVESFEFRRSGVSKIADQLPNAISASNAKRQGAQDIAADMQDFLTSDVIYAGRVQPSIARVLKSRSLAAEETAPRSQFLPSIDWLAPATVASRIGKLGGSGGSGGPVAPGLHGTGLGTVTLGGQALTAGNAVSVSASGSPSFQVQVSNQGQNTETNIKVTVVVGTGGDATTLTKTLDTIAAGETKPVSLPLTGKPPTGQNLPVSVTIATVPGEKQTDNNKGSFSVIFTS